MVATGSNHSPFAELAGPVNDSVEIDPIRSGEGLARIIRAGIAVFIVLLIVAMFPVSPRPAIDIKILLYQLAAGILGGIWLSGAILGRVPLRWPRIFGPILVLMLVGHGASVYAANYPPTSLLAVSRTFCVMMLFLVASQVYSTARQARPLLVAVCVGVGLSTLYAFAQKAGIDPFPWGESQRETATYLEMPGTFGNPNVAGHALILAMIFAGYLATVRSTRWCGLFLPLFASHLYLTHFRAGLLALASGLAVTALAAGMLRLRRTPAWTARVTVALTLAGGLAVAVSAIGYAYNASANHRLLDDSVLLRYNAYYGAAQMIAEKPVSGFGPGMYAVENPPHWTDYEQRWLAEQHLLNEHVHSDVLEAWVETGVAGAMAYVLFLLAGVYFSIRHAAQSEGEARRFGLALTAFFAAFAMDGLFGFNSRVPVTAVLLFVIAGVLEGAHRSALGPPVRISNTSRAVALVLAGALANSTVFGTRDFLAKMFTQSARNELAYRAIANADRDSNRALRYAPYYPAAHVTRAGVELRLGFRDRAIKQYEIALRLQPYNVPMLVGFARIHLSSALNIAQRGSLDESDQALERAKDYADRALKLCPYLPDAEEVLGRAALAKAQLTDPEFASALAQQAETHFLAALRNGAGNVGELLALEAECRLIAGDHDGAEANLVKAAKHDPSAPEAWKAFLRFASRTGRFDGLESALETAIARADNLNENQSAGKLRAWRAQAYILSARPAGDVADEFDQALRDAPDAAQIWVDYAAAAHAPEIQERFREAVRSTSSTLPQLIALKPALSESSRMPVQAAVALHELAGRVMTPGYVTLQAGDIAWTLEHAQEAILDPSATGTDRVEGLAYIAAAYELLERNPQAANAYRLVAEYATGPAYVAAVIKAGSLLVTMSKFEESVALLEKAMKQHMNSVPLRLEYARALHAAGKPAAARMELNALRAQFNLDSDQRAAVDAATQALSQ